MPGHLTQAASGGFAGLFAGQWRAPAGAGLPAKALAGLAARAKFRGSQGQDGVRLCAQSPFRTRSTCEDSR
ncbi:conserved hypothetical protein [Pseudomonas protegens Pf-5]|uniref:Uncharacterized protein n=1 Tax=Pseudomonas fluorescens (strain ATCC BAA-477 / NRRL B-23932 / Pf-5) TaxID=220664 RepID=Q4KBR0_PSEF5|nr:conserved hypothetical protein [Pseudomonas protegens Pf-5]